MAISDLRVGPSELRRRVRTTLVSSAPLEQMNAAPLSCRRIFDSMWYILSNACKRNMSAPDARRPALEWLK